MKRMIACVIVFLLLSCSVSAIADEAGVFYGNLYDGDITFRGIPFGSTFKEVSDLLQTEGCSLWLYGSGYCYTPLNLLSSSNASYPEIGFNGSAHLPTDKKVAGYEIAIAQLYGVASVKDGILCSEQDDALFHGAQYQITPPDTSIAYEDLLEKLTSVYGAPYAEGSYWMIPEYNPSDYFAIFSFGDQEMTFWRSSTNNAVLALVNDYIGTDFNVIRIVYVWLDGDSAIEEAFQTQQAAIQQEYHDNVYNNGNTDGL